MARLAALPQRCEGHNSICDFQLNTNYTIFLFTDTL